MTETAPHPKRAVAYVRESTEEQGRGYSPDGQRQAITRYAAEHGMTLGEEYLDFETGRAAEKRPGFQRLITDAMEHHFDCVLVFHTSRFARNTVEAKRYKKLLRSQLGIDVISVTQPLGNDADDPASFLSESVHEIFDEYYSVSLSFWTKMGLREKARQGLLTGSLPWGYVKGQGGIAQPDPEKAPYVRSIFEMYATGQHTDRTLTAWLNLHDQRTTRGRAFGVDTVREMLCNTAYAGYVSARRDTSKTIKGQHAPIIEEALFDRVQQMRRQRARTLNPGRPSPNYLLRGLARCRRCHGRMQGTTGGRQKQTPLLLLNPTSGQLLRPAHHPRRTSRGTARPIPRRLHTRPRDARADPHPPRGQHTRELRDHQPALGARTAPAPHSRSLRTRRPATPRIHRPP
jgi:site-specific DNA recombinase